MNQKGKLKVFWGIVIGATIGAMIMLAKMMFEKETGGFSIGTLMGVVIAMVFGAVSSYLLSSRKNNKTIPEVDERTVFVMKNYFVWALYFVLIGSALVSVCLYLMDVQTIEIGMLFVYQALLFVLIGAGAFVAKRV